MSVLELIRPELRSLPAYIPGGEDATYRLHTNELPWSPIKSQELNLNRYPNYKVYSHLQKQLAQRYHVNSDQLVLTRGSDDGIDLIFRLFVNSGQDSIMQFPPTFPLYAFYARLQQGELIQCPLESNNLFSFPIESIESHWNPGCKVIILCNPNNPTASYIDLESINRLCKQFKDRSVIVVDEAYIEFTPHTSASTLINQNDNLIILRTLSKAYGLAGIRLGAVITQAPLAHALMNITAPYTISILALSIASKALVKEAWHTKAIEKIGRQRKQLINQLKKAPIVEMVYPTETNFVLLKLHDAKKITALLSENGIAIRDFPNHPILHDHIRLTVGNAKTNSLVIDLLTR
jgi:histidinol-phosphate aminotransferase